MYSSTYQTFHHVLYLFDEVRPRTIQYSPGVHLSLVCAATRLARYSILPSSHSLRPCDFDHDCDLAITTATLRLRHCDYYDFVPRHHCDVTILRSCDPHTMHATPDITIEGHPRPYLHPLLLRHREQPQPLGLTVFVRLSGVGSPINARSHFSPSGHLSVYQKLIHPGHYAQSSVCMLLQRACCTPR